MARGEGGGRPTKYEVRFNRMAYRAALLGASDIEIADLLEVTESTLYKWKNEYPKFSEAIKKGKEDADSRVAESMYKRATGYSHKDVDIKVIDGQIVTTPLTKHYPPDPTSMIFWLKNRQPKKWRDKQEIGATDKDGNDVPFVFAPVPNINPIEIKGNE